jgi:hypothetical protein
MTAFFMPGNFGNNDGRAVELAYGEMRGRVELEMGRAPSTRRIEKLWTRRGSIDCVTEVGQPDPLRGGTVVAIFDMGPHQPFVVCREADASTGDGCREILGVSAYSVLEFEP